MFEGGDQNPPAEFDVRVMTCGTRKHATIRIQTGLKVLNVKKRIADAWGLPEDRHILVYSGRVLDDDVTLENLVAQFQHEATLWLVVRNVWPSCPVPALGVDSCMDLLDWDLIIDIDALNLKQCSVLFTAFCSVHSQTTGSTQWTWSPCQESKAALRSVVHVLKKEVGTKHFPQVNWDLGDGYGCALLATSTSVERVSLQVPCSCICSFTHSCYSPEADSHFITVSKLRS